MVIKIKFSNYIFLIDSIGALISAICLGVLLSTFSQLIGIPKNILLSLIFWALALSFYSFISHLFFKNAFFKKLLMIILFNFSYCLYTGTIVLKNVQQVTLLGKTYFIIEILIILILVSFEIKILNNYKTKK